MCEISAQDGGKYSVVTDCKYESSCWVHYWTSMATYVYFDGAEVGKIKHCHGPLARYVKLRVAHAPGMPGAFSPPPRVSDPDMHHGTCVTHVPWCMPGSLTSGFLWIRRRGKRSKRSRHMCNPLVCVSGKRPIPATFIYGCKHYDHHK